MKPSELAHGKCIAVEFPAAKLDYVFTREGKTIWFGACVRADVWPPEDGEDTTKTHPQIELSPKAADALHRKLTSEARS